LSREWRNPADAPDLGSGARKGVGVQISPLAPGLSRDFGEPCTCWHRAPGPADNKLIHKLTGGRLAARHGRAGYFNRPMSDDLIPVQVQAPLLGLTSDEPSFDQLADELRGLGYAATFTRPDEERSAGSYRFLAFDVTVYVWQYLAPPMATLLVTTVAEWIKRRFGDKQHPPTRVKLIYGPKREVLAEVPVEKSAQDEEGSEPD
jgi:hypothetical protein